MKFIFLSCIWLLSSCSLEQTNKFNKGKWIDLTHSFDKKTTYWPSKTSFSLDTIHYGKSKRGFFYSSFKFSAEEHGGTHVDAPIHFCKDKNTVDKIKLTQLTGPGIVINVSKKTLVNKDYLISKTDFINWEKKHGQIPKNSIILIQTGYSKYWDNKTKYWGTKKVKNGSIPELHFPGLDSKAATWLSTQRKIKAIGLDTPSIDFGQSQDFLAHRTFCKKNILIFENVTNLKNLPETGSYIIALPMKIKGGSGAPLRIVAFIPQ